MSDKELNRLMEQVEVTSSDSKEEAILTFEADDNNNLLPTRVKTSRITFMNELLESSDLDQSSEEFNLFPEIKSETVCKPTSTDQRKYKLFFIDNPNNESRNCILHN